MALDEQNPINDAGQVNNVQPEPANINAGSVSSSVINADGRPSSRKLAQKIFHLAPKSVVGEAVGNNLSRFNYNESENSDTERVITGGVVGIAALQQAVMKGEVQDEELRRVFAGEFTNADDTIKGRTNQILKGLILLANKRGQTEVVKELLEVEELVEKNPELVTGIEQRVSGEMKVVMRDVEVDKPMDMPAPVTTVPVVEEKKKVATPEKKSDEEVEDDGDEDEQGAEKPEEQQEQKERVQEPEIVPEQVLQMSNLESPESVEAGEVQTVQKKYEHQEAMRRARTGRAQILTKEFSGAVSNPGVVTHVVSGLESNPIKHSDNVELTGVQEVFGPAIAGASASINVSGKSAPSFTVKESAGVSGGGQGVRVSATVPQQVLVEALESLTPKQGEVPNQATKNKIKIFSEAIELVNKHQPEMSAIAPGIQKTAEQLTVTFHPLGAQNSSQPKTGEQAPAESVSGSVPVQAPPEPVPSPTIGGKLGTEANGNPQSTQPQPAPEVTRALDSVPMPGPIKAPLQSKTGVSDSVLTQQGTGRGQLLGRGTINPQMLVAMHAATQGFLKKYGRLPLMTEPEDKENYEKLLLAEKAQRGFKQGGGEYGIVSQNENIPPQYVQRLQEISDSNNENEFVNSAPPSTHQNIPGSINRDIGASGGSAAEQPPLIAPLASGVGQKLESKGAEEGKEGLTLGQSQTGGTRSPTKKTRQGLPGNSPVEPINEDRKKTLQDAIARNSLAKHGLGRATKRILASARKYGANEIFTFLLEIAPGDLGIITIGLGGNALWLFGSRFGLKLKFFYKAIIIGYDIIIALLILAFIFLLVVVACNGPLSSEDYCESLHVLNTFF